MVKPQTNIAKKSRGSEMKGKSLSCDNLIFPRRYIPQNAKMTIQMIRNTSRSNTPQWYAKSTFDKNLKAKASSKNPKETLTVFNHPPDFGISFNQDGKMANSVNGMANAAENPNIPIAGPR